MSSQRAKLRSSLSGQEHAASQDELPQDIEVGGADGGHYLEEEESSQNDQISSNECEPVKDELSGDQDQDECEANDPSVDEDESEADGPSENEDEPVSRNKVEISSNKRFVTDHSASSSSRSKVHNIHHKISKRNASLPSTINIYKLKYKQLHRRYNLLEQQNRSNLKLLHDALQENSR